MERLKFVKENLFPDLRIEEFVGKESDWNIDTSGKLDVRQSLSSTKNEEKMRGI